MNASFGPFIVIVLALLAGIGFRRSGHLPAAAPRTLNAYVIAIALPALVLAQLPGFLRQLGGADAPLDGSLLFLPLVPWIIFAAAILVFGAFFRVGWIRREQWGLLALSAGLGNTAFVGFPLIEALLGAEKLPMAILLDQLGTFLALSVGGTLWISYFRASTAKFSARKFFGELFRFPPFLALIASFLLFPWAPFPTLAQDVLERFAATLVPAAMVSVGAQLRFERAMFIREWRGIVYGLGYKMAIAPLLIGFMAITVFGMRDERLAVAVLEAAMAPMITSTVLGIEAGLAPDLGALMLGIGIPLSLATVPLVHALMRTFG